MKLNKKVEIGVNVISVLRQKDGFMTASEIAPQVGTTVNFLEQVMRNLKSSGLIAVKRGKNGGYTLNRENPNAITALDVARAVGKFPQGLDAADVSASNLLTSSIIETFRTMKL